MKLLRLKLHVTNRWMLEKRKGYIDQLLRDLKLLEERISTVRDNDSLPFSFFRQSFDRIQEIYRTLHLLEFLQINEMRGQMERLVHFLSEVENKEAREKEAQEKEAQEKDALEKDAPKEPKEPKKEAVTPVITPGANTRDIEFPEYRNPRANEDTLVSIPSRPAVVDLKRRISLNDRFLFQRELFGNSRQEMDRAMEQLGKLQTYAEAETYLRESLSLDPEDATVSDFLHVIKQGFE